MWYFYGRFVDDIISASVLEALFSSQFHCMISYLCILVGPVQAAQAGGFSFFLSRACEAFSFFGFVGPVLLCAHVGQII